MPRSPRGSKLPGYLLDSWGVPYGQKRKGTTGGKMPLENYFYRRKGEKKLRHIARYRLRVGKKQKPFYPKYLMAARLHAENEWRGRERT